MVKPEVIREIETPKIFRDLDIQTITLSRPEDQTLFWFNKKKELVDSSCSQEKWKRKNEQIPTAEEAVKHKSDSDIIKSNYEGGKINIRLDRAGEVIFCKLYKTTIIILSYVHTPVKSI